MSGWPWIVSFTLLDLFFIVYLYIYIYISLSHTLILKLSLAHTHIVIRWLFTQQIKTKLYLRRGDRPDTHSYICSPLLFMFRCIGVYYRIFNLNIKLMCEKAWIMFVFSIENFWYTQANYISRLILLLKCLTK